MPVAIVSLRSGDAKSKETKPRFLLPFDLIGEAAAVFVANARRQAIAQRDEMLALQRGTPDREMQRFFKGEAREALKRYRAACLLLPWVSSDLPGDCELSDPYEWPAELFPALNLIADGACCA